MLRRDAIGALGMLAALLCAVYISTDGSPGGAADAPAFEAEITASRTSGAAPLAVFFDATQSDTDGDGLSGDGSDWTDDIVHARFQWDFGETTGETWAGDGTTKDTDEGPWAAHVFRGDGPYTVTLTVTAPDGTTDTDTVSIDPTPADTQWSSTATTCYRETATGDFTGCPTGATQSTESSWATLCGALSAGERVLLRRGDAWTGAGDCTYTGSASPAMIGAFGSGADPSVTGTGTLINIDEAQDFRLVGIDFTDTGSDDSYTVEDGHGVEQDILVEGISITTSDSRGLNLRRFDLSGSTISSRIFVMDSTLDCSSQVNSGNCVYFIAEEVAFVGNDLTGGISHGFRSNFLKPGTITHNNVRGSGTIRHVFKIHSGDSDAATGTGSSAVNGKENGLFTFSFNLIGDGTTDCGDWILAFGPQTGSTPDNEQIRYVIAEGNHIRGCPIGGTDESVDAVKFWAADSVWRRNLIDFSTFAGSPDGIEFIQRSGQPADISGNKAYNNTFYFQDTEGVDGIEFGTATGSEAENNLIYAPNTSDVDLVNGITQTASNIEATSDPFASATSNGAASNFKITAASEPEDAGSVLSAMFVDYFGLDILGAVTPDAGFHELESEP